MHRAFLADVVCLSDKESYWDNVPNYDCRLVVEHARVNNESRTFVFVKWPTERWMIGGLMDRELEQRLSTMNLLRWTISIPMFMWIPVGKYSVYKSLIYAYKDLDSGDDETLANPKKSRQLFTPDEFPDFVPRHFGQGTIELP